MTMPMPSPPPMDLSSSSSATSGDAKGGFFNSGGEWNVATKGFDMNDAVPWIVGGLLLWTYLRLKLS